MSADVRTAAPRVTLVAVTRNRAAFVRKALDHWAALKGPDDELVVVDGNSTDGTYELLHGAPRGLVDTLIHEPDLSEAHALNKGLLVARGRYIKFVSDDDLFYRDALEKAYAALDADVTVDLMVTGGESIDQIDDPSNLVPSHYQWYPDGARLTENHAFVTMIGMGLIVRHSSLPMLGLFDPRHLHADTSYFTQATVRGAAMRYLRVKGFSHRVGAQSMSRQNRRKSYIYRDFGFKALSRWRYLNRPMEPLRSMRRQLARRLGRKPVLDLEVPVWDGKILA